MAYCLGSLRTLTKPVAWKRLIPVQILPLATAPNKLKPGEDFWEKNTRMNRPMSPHLTIYKFQITSVMSITHRTTGLILSGALYGFAISTIFMSSNFAHYLEYLQSLHMGSAAICSVKFALAWTFFYHMANGIRHLAWDLGYGYEIKDLNMTGYAVLGSSLLLSGIAACM